MKNNEKLKEEIIHSKRLMGNKRLIKESWPLVDLELEFVETFEYKQAKQEVQLIIKELESKFNNFSVSKGYGDIGDDDVDMTFNNICSNLIER